MLYLELAIVAVLTCVNGLLAMSELAIVSSRPARLRQMVERDVVGSRRALVLASDPGRFLSTVQIGITLVGVFSGAFSGATLGLRLTGWLIGVGLPPGLAETIGVATVVIGITYASLIIGELVPKQIALRDPEGVAVKVAPAMTVLAKVAMPLVWLLDASGKLILRLIGQSAKAEGKLTEDELKSVIAEAESAGVLEPGEREMIAGVMRLADRTVSAVMTPRRDVDMIDLAADAETVRKRILDTRHTNLPACDGNPDETLGVIQVKDLLDAYVSGRTIVFEEFVRQAPIIPETADVLDILATLKQSPVHMGLVHDEYGHLGVVTTADILEAIVGVFRTHDDSDTPYAVQREDGSYLISGSMPVDEFRELLNLPGAQDNAYHTVAGFVLEGFGYLPKAGESFDAAGWRFEVVDMDGRRVDKLLASKLTAPRRAARA
jgi:putative hemolysin